MFKKKDLPQGFHCSCPGVVYMYVTSSLANQRQILFVGSMERGYRGLHKWSRSILVASAYEKGIL